MNGIHFVVFADSIPYSIPRTGMGCNLSIRCAYACKQVTLFKKAAMIVICIQNIGIEGNFIRGLF